jgi:hypothetical protein
LSHRVIGSIELFEFIELLEFIGLKKIKAHSL